MPCRFLEILVLLGGFYSAPCRVGEKMSLFTSEDINRKFNDVTENVTFKSRKVRNAAFKFARSLAFLIISTQPNAFLFLQHFANE